MSIKKKDLQGMGIEELKSKLNELKKEMIKTNAQIATGTIPKSPGQIKAARKTVARILTFLRQKEKTKEK